MKKRSKEKVATQRKSHQQQGFSSLSAQTILRRAQSFPLFECLISADWDKKESSGLVEILLARKSIDYAAQFGFTPDKDFAVSQYLLAPRGELAETYKLMLSKG